MTAPAVLPPTDARQPRQRATHRRLLQQVATAEAEAQVDAIIVPAARPAGSLNHATRLAAELGCPLLVLCSLDAKPEDVLAHTAGAGVAVFAVESPPKSNVPVLETKGLLPEDLRRRTDTPGKRNFGLALAWMAGWERVLFLDDDIDIRDASEVRRAAALLDEYEVVGLDNVGFPDNSVVCHAHRDTGGEQGTFIGSGAMLFRRSRATSFFATIYNEDWFFLLDPDGLARCAVYGTFSQARFDPYAVKNRAATEEFGDCLAEGLFSLLDDGRSLDEAATTHFWEAFLADRGQFIAGVLSRLETTPGISVFRRMQMAEALHAARTSLHQFTAEECVGYLKTWQVDRQMWRSWIEGLPVGLTIDEARAHLTS
ncbi:hypothetical protein OWR29_17375 [Actinoplanes sp. Pm04-4]|uniref:Glycosyltransferase n=1 Tax=Paractinoplanes pyxinae TaxID=2997416 RepID=A0ABT4AZX4_9ACTN|nr:hypothetical protein [Actinoplanes pyxinae]MCY1139775.1 hypothetical protein [Actinoplanes pyxinae]